MRRKDETATDTSDACEAVERLNPGDRRDLVAAYDADNQLNVANADVEERCGRKERKRTDVAWHDA